MLGASAFLLVAVAVQAALCSPLNSRASYAVKETHRVPRRWNVVGRATGHETINLQIGLKQSQFDELERHLYEGQSELILISSLK
jgi:tripeptidyl-peptidase I